MESSSKKITADKLTDPLLGLFGVSYASLFNGVKPLLKEQTSISEKKEQELLVVAMLSVLRTTIVALGDKPETKYIVGKFQNEIFNQYSLDIERQRDFKELFNKRCAEYQEVLKPENKDSATQFGQTFCNHFFGKEEDGTHLGIMMFVGTSFFQLSVETKKFLDEILSTHELVM